MTSPWLPDSPTSYLQSFSQYWSTFAHTDTLSFSALEKRGVIFYLGMCPFNSERQMQWSTWTWVSKINFFSFDNFIEPANNTEANVCRHNNGIVDNPDSKYHFWLFSTHCLLGKNLILKKGRKENFTWAIFSPCVPLLNITFTSASMQHNTVCLSPSEIVQLLYKWGGFRDNGCWSNRQWSTNRH